MNRGKWATKASEVLAMRESGMTYRAMAEHYGVSPDRMKQVVQKLKRDIQRETDAASAAPDSIYALDISVQARNSILRSGIETISKLVHRYRIEGNYLFERFWMFGEGRRREVLSALRKCGYLDIEVEAAPPPKESLIDLVEYMLYSGHLQKYTSADGMVIEIDYAPMLEIKVLLDLD
jgi:hypothetical protein